MKRVLSSKHLIAMGVNAIIGSGIFLCPGILAKNLGLFSPWLFLACGLLLATVGIQFAHLSKLTDRNGGPYLYAQLAFGNIPAFLIGWIAWFCSMVSTGAVASAFGIYLSHFFPNLTPIHIQNFSIVTILFFGLLNTVGVKYGGASMLFLTILKTLPLLLFAGFGLVNSFQLPWQELSTQSFNSSEWPQMLLIIFFTYQGFEAVPIIAGETKHPQSAVPKGIYYSLFFSALIYFFVQMGILGGPAVGSSKPLADQGLFLFGKLGGDLVALLGIISVLGFIAGVSLSASRYLTPLVEDDLLPKFLGWESKRFQTPYIAILITQLGSIACVLHSGIQDLMILAALAVCLQYLIAPLAVWKLSKKAGSTIPYSSYVAFVVSLIFLWNVPPKSWIVAVQVLALGIALLLAHRLRKQSVYKASTSS